MATQTWSFNSGFNGWTFEDVSAIWTVNPCPGCSTSRAHVAGAIRITFIVDNLPNVTAASENAKDNLNVAVQNNDTIEVDYSATSDGLNELIVITATYTDETSESVQTVHNAAGTLILTLTQNKILDKIDIVQARSTSGTALGSTHTSDLEEVRLIVAGGIVATPGKLRTPQSFIEDEGAGAAGGAGGGSGGNIASMSSDGLFIYIASFNNLGFPTIIKISAVLTADGTVVFDPGDGGRIGVQCGKYNEEHLWIAGQFDGTNTIEKSEDAGANFTVKDDATFGAIRTFEIGPDTDERVIIFDGDNGDIIETLDDGATWTDHNTTVTPLVNSIARFNESPAEIVAGNEGAANDSINYSPNSGANLADYQTGVYPATDATKVIAN